MADRQWGFATRAVHAGGTPDAVTGARAVPIYQTTSFVFDDTTDASALFALQKFGNIYSRIANPTVSALEERLASLDGGLGAVATASGQAAEFLTFAALAGAGEEIVAGAGLYGGTITQLDVTLRRFGVETTFVPGAEPEKVAAAISERTKVVFAEVIANPSGEIADLAALADVAHAAGIPLAVDATLATPYLCRPIEHGADIVIHSATKFLGGHGTTMGGVVVESGKFPWDNGKFPAMTEPSVGYHGVKFYETFGDFGFTMKARMEVLRVFGPAISPFNAWLLLQGIETLPVRMDRHCANAMAVAKFLEAHPKVSWVNYPGLPGNPYHALATRYMPKGAGSLLSFGIQGGYDAAVKFIEALTFVSHLANIGDAKSLVIHPASTTHRQLDEEQQKKAGVPPDMVRLSIGLESIGDILWDLERALA